jgi:hypothetical protein
LSSKGYAVYSQIVPIAARFEAQLVSALTKQEQKQLDQLLDKLNQHATCLSGFDLS